MRIKKVFNSSVVLATGPDDAELILLGKGIGYGQRPGDLVPEGAPDRFFVPVSSPAARELLQLLDSIRAGIPRPGPRDHRLRRAGARHDAAHQHLYVALTDHLHFAVERAHAGLPVVQPAGLEDPQLLPGGVPDRTLWRRLGYGSGCTSCYRTTRRPISPSTSPAPGTPRTGRPSTFGRPG
ncbi:MAG: CAT RNA binding domain-containing protein [Micropruina sp.]